MYDVGKESGIPAEGAAPAEVRRGERKEREGKQVGLELRCQPGREGRLQGHARVLNLGNPWVS